MRKNYLLLLVIFLIAGLQAHAGDVTITVTKSTGASFAGVSVTYYVGYWKSFGTTNASGEATATIPDGSYTFRASVGGTSQQQVIAVAGVTAGAFQSSKVTAHVTKSDNSDFPGVAIAYYRGYWQGIGNTGVDGKASVEIFDGNYTFRASVGGTTKQNSAVVVNGNTTTSFQSSKVTAHVAKSDNSDFSGVAISYYRGYWQGIGSTGVDGNASVEIFDGTYDFRASVGGTTEQNSGVVVNGNTTTSFQSSKVTAHVAKSDNSDFSGVAISYNRGYWQGIGSTGVDGKASVELFDGTYDFRASVGGTSTQNSGEVISGNTSISFQSSKATFHANKSDGTPLAGVGMSYDRGYWQGVGATNGSGDVSAELFPGSYNTKASKGGTSSTQNIVLGATGLVVYHTTEVVLKAIDCDNSDPIPGVGMSYNRGYWQGVGNTNGSGQVTTHLFPGARNFKGYTDGTQAVQNHVVPGDGVAAGQTTTITFNPTRVDFGFSGSVSYHIGYWKGLTSPDYLFPGTYNFKFDGTVVSLTISGCAIEGNIHIFKTLKADGSPLANIPIARNDYGNHYVAIGNTDASGFLLTMNLPSGTTKFRASKNSTSQYITSPPSVFIFQTARYVVHTQNSDGADLPGVASGFNDYGNHYLSMGNTDSNGESDIELYPGTRKFRAVKNSTIKTGTLDLASGDSQSIVLQTSKYVVNVKESDCTTDFPGIAVGFNDYGNHYLGMGNTDASGKAEIQLFPGNRKFRAVKHSTTKTGYLDIPNSGMTDVLVLSTSKYIVHVQKSDGTDFPGIATGFNDYGNHYFNMGTTDATGRSEIQLFPGSRKFRAVKHSTSNNGTLIIPASCATGTIIFKTALVTAFVKDCDNNSPIAGIGTGFNDYGNHYLNMGNTDASGKSYLELFPGSTYKFRATTISTVEFKTEYLLAGGITVEFNPTRVCFQYAGNVRYNDYGNHWRLVPCNTYMFPGTYDFRFYDGNAIDYQASIAISGCAIEESLIFVQLQNSGGADLANGSFKYRFGYGSYTTIGTDAVGDGMWYFVAGSPSNTKVKVSYAGASVEKQQNIQTDPKFIFNTVIVTADLETSSGGPLVADSWQYRYGYGSYSPLMNGGQELLPVNTKVRVGYKGTTVEKQQNVGNSPNYVFSTVKVTADLKDSGGGPLTADSWQYRYGYGTYATLANDGEELLPVNVKVRVGYKGTTVEKQQNVGNSPNYVFSTVKVKADLKDSGGGPLTADSWQYRYGYGTYATLANDGEELLPVNVKVRVGYKGTAVEKQQHVGSASHYAFSTVKVTAHLENSGGGILAADSWQYRYGYGPYSTLANGGEELLPVNVKVRVGYKGTAVEKQQHVGSSPGYTFKTVNVTASLVDGGVPLTADSWQYRYGYGPYATLDNAGEELLPVNVKVKVIYSGNSKEKQQNVGSSPTYLFTWDGTNISLIAFDDGSSDLQDNSSLMPNISEEEAGDYQVGINYPNPFSQSTTIDYSLPVEKRVTLIIYDASGKQVKILVDGVKQSGDHQAQWDGRSDSGQLIPGGVYYYQFRSGNTMVTKSMIRID